MTQLNRLIGDQSAARDGVLMFRDGGVVVSVDGEWAELADTAAVGAIEANVRKANFDATRAPLPTDDETQGYAAGSRWLWQGQEWVAASVSSGAAVWRSPGRLNTALLPATAPYLNVSRGGVAPPANHVFVQQDTSHRSDAATVQVQRLVTTDDGLTNPKALRVYTQVGIDTTQTEWAISGELDNHSDLSGAGSTAVSGVSNKYGLGSVFGGHFQSKDWSIYALDTDVTGVVGAEINCPVVGFDHPTGNNSLGLRRCLDVIARTNQQVPNWNTAGGNDGDGETGTGIVIRTDNATDGYFRFGLVIDDVSQTGNPNPIGVGLLCRTSGADGISIRGANTGAGLRVVPSTPGPYGIRVQGAFTIAALGVDTGAWIALSTDGTRKLRYSAGTEAFEIYSGPAERFRVRTNASPALFLDGTQVVGTRRPAVADAATGTEVTTINSILAALRAHGLIAT